MILKTTILIDTETLKDIKEITKDRQLLSHDNTIRYLIQFYYSKRDKNKPQIKFEKC